MWVLDGAALIGPEGSEVQLERGDFVSFHADVSHVYRPTSSGEVRLLLLMHYPPPTTGGGRTS